MAFRCAVRRLASATLCLLPACLLPGLAVAQTAPRPLVVELFTSEGCSSCPPADALVADLARRRPDILALTFHVTYWNNLGWQDPFSFDAATARQRRYVALAVSPEVYTPAMVIDGRLDVVGSNGPAVEASLARAATERTTAAPVSILRQADQLGIDIGAGRGHGSVLLLGYDRLHQTHVGRGENSGRTLLEANIVRAMTNLGSWDGHALHLTAQVPPGDVAAVLVQADDGQIIGAGQRAGS